MKELLYPFDSEYILMKKKKIKKQLLQSDMKFIQKKIAILGGATTAEVRNILELFLLNNGIKADFYESEYDKYYEDAVFGSPELTDFAPDIVYIHTCNRNIIQYPEITDTSETVDRKLDDEYKRFLQIWESLRAKFGCTIIQNNMEYPNYRLLGNKDSSDIHGRVNYLLRLNLKFAEYAEKTEGFFINDINYQSAQFGLDRWSDQSYWYMYKYAPAVPAIPTLAFNVANIIKAVYGKNKKALVMDLDNTLWGGIVGDDGVDKLEIGPETACGEAYSEFQEYIKQQKSLGILLAVNSKNEYENAVSGLSHPNSKLNKDDFVVIKANWNLKTDNLCEISDELNIGKDSFVFVDDNPAEREIIISHLPEVAVPDMGNQPERYITILDHNGFFESTGISEDDIEKTKMYIQNTQRAALSKSFCDYGEFLRSLQMYAEIQPFNALYRQRIAQLTNKSNQFNLTTRRYSSADIEAVSDNEEYITLYGKLQDKFGDNGVVAVSIGHIVGHSLEIDLFLMSCRVLKRDMECAMMDELVERSAERKLTAVYGYYYPTKKNKMVKEFYRDFGFVKISEDTEGNTKWELKISDYSKKNRYINIGVEK